ncbi:MAG: hypothetical protein ABIQ93_06130 [Saprospiraceae bacterium]
MEIVSYHLAQKLKQTGFPQPEPKKGQTWHTNPIQPVKVGGSTALAGEVWIGTSRSNWPITVEVLQASSAFAPTREDLQMELAVLLPAGIRPAQTPASADELAELWLEMKEQGERVRQR